MTLTASDFEALLQLHHLMTRTSIDDLKEILRDHVDHRGAATAAVAWLASVVGTERFAEAAVEAGVLEHDGYRYPKVYWSDEAAGFTVRVWGEEQDDYDKATDPRPDSAVAIYRIGGTDA